MEAKQKKIGLCIVCSAAAVIFLVLPAYSEFVRGDSRQFLSQPYLWRDAAETAIYAAAILLLGILAKGKKGIVTMAVCAVYLLSTGTLAQCLVSYVYIEILLCIGRSFLALLFPNKRECAPGIQFLAGSALWGSCGIFLSLCGLGTIDELRILTIVLTMVSILNPKHKMGSDDLLVVKYVRYLNGNRRGEFLLNIFFVLIMLISCARVNTFLEFDSLWYALYPEKCLFGENSFYDFLGYTDFVYYYPKFKELLMAPIAGLGLPGYLVSANLWIMVIGVVEVYRFLCRNIQENRIEILGVVYLLFSTVCIVGISSTAKSDAISYLYLLMLIIYFLEYFRTKEYFYFWIALTSGILSYTVKYTNFLFSTIVFAVAAGYFLFHRIVRPMKQTPPGDARANAEEHVAVATRLRRRIRQAGFFFMLAEGETKPEKKAPQGIILALAAGFVFLGILYRTCELTGYPTYREATGVWEAIGFQGKPYFDAEIKDKPENVLDLKRIYNALFDVGKEEKMNVAWTGNYSVFLGICMLTLYRRRRKDRNTLMLVIAAALAFSSLYFLVTMAAPDGNYFSVPIIVVTCYMLMRMTASSYWKENRKWFVSVISLFLLLNLAFVFVTHPSRQTGTRMWGKPVSLIMTTKEKQSAYEFELRNLGVYEINERLKERENRIFLMADGSDPRMSMLEARVEIAGGFFQGYLSGADVETYQDFVEYMDYVGLDGFILLKESGMEPFGEYVRQYIAEYGCVEELDTEKYSYYRIR